MSTQNVIPAIKLFGRNIPTPEGQIPAVPDIGFKIPTESHVAIQTEKSDVEKHSSANKAQVGSRCGEDQPETNQNEQEKTFKKPDKILPCPRCNSFDTKFCYFNNYNVNQPRHFCKNCQRYWTAGGTMRNVPVGAGRRKHKQFAASQYRQAVFSVNRMVPPTRGLESPESTNHHMLFPGELASPLTPPEVRGSAVLKFGAEATFSESMDSGFNLRGQCGTAESGSGIISEGREEPSFVTEADSTSSGSSDSNGNPPQQFPALFVPYQSGWQNLETPIRAFPNHFQGYDRNSVQWRPPQVVTIPGVCTQPTIPLQIIPSPYLGYVPLAVLNSCLSPCSPVTNGIPSVRGSPTLGKHLRDVDSGAMEKSENGVLVPKTLRIDDPNEASRSPIWATLGIKPNEKVSSSMLSGKPKCAGSESQEAANVKEANPVAFSRSQSFQEST